MVDTTTLAGIMAASYPPAPPPVQPPPPPPPAPPPVASAPVQPPLASGAVDTSTPAGIDRASGPPKVNIENVLQGHVDATVLGVVDPGDSVWRIAHTLHEGMSPEMQKLNPEPEIRARLTGALVKDQGYDANSADSNLATRGRQGDDLDLLQPGQQIRIDLEAPNSARKAWEPSTKAADDANTQWVALDAKADPKTRGELAAVTQTNSYATGAPELQKGALDMFQTGGRPRALVQPLLHDNAFLQLLPGVQQQVMAAASTPQGAAVVNAIVGSKAGDEQRAGQYTAVANAGGGGPAGPGADPQTDAAH